MKTLLLSILLCGLLINKAAFAECASDLNSLGSLFRTENFSSKWVETTMKDGNPLVVTITPRGGNLFLQFMKTNAGLWASGYASICEESGTVTATIAGDQIKLGSAAPFVMRMAMGGGASFRLTLISPQRLQISTSGWHSEFAPSR